MLCFLSKSAQALTVQDDQALLAPYKQVGNYFQGVMRNRKTQKQRQRWDKRRRSLEQMRDSGNGNCQVCKLPLVKDSRGRLFCPDPACELSTNAPKIPQKPQIPLK